MDSELAENLWLFKSCAFVICFIVCVCVCVYVCMYVCVCVCVCVLFFSNGADLAKHGAADRNRPALCGDIDAWRGGA